MLQGGISPRAVDESVQVGHRGGRGAVGHVLGRSADGSILGSAQGGFTESEASGASPHEGACGAPRGVSGWWNLQGEASRRVVGRSEGAMGTHPIGSA